MILHIQAYYMGLHGFYYILYTSLWLVHNILRVCIIYNKIHRCLITVWNQCDVNIRHIGQIHLLTRCFIDNMKPLSNYYFFEQQSQQKTSNALDESNFHVFIVCDGRIGGIHHTGLSRYWKLPRALMLFRHEMWVSWLNGESTEAGVPAIYQWCSACPPVLIESQWSRGMVINPCVSTHTHTHALHANRTLGSTPKTA